MKCKNNTEIDPDNEIETRGIWCDTEISIRVCRGLYIYIYVYISGFLIAAYGGTICRSIQASSFPIGK